MKYDWRLSLIEEAQDLATGVLVTRAGVVHDAKRCGEHDVTEATGRQNVLHPLLHVRHSHVETRRDDSALVDAADELDHDLARAVVVDHLKLPNVSILLHHLQKLDDHLGRWPDNHLPLTPLLRVGDGL